MQHIAGSCVSNYQSSDQNTRGGSIKKQLGALLAATTFLFTFSAMAAAPLAAPHKGKYRYDQKYLFQTVSSRYIPNRLVDGTGFLWDIYGPTYKYVDSFSGWSWKNPGGDWLDADLVPQGTKPWFSIPAGTGLTRYDVRTHSGDVTKAVQYCANSARWCAFLLTSKGSPRTMATPFDKVNGPPTLHITYANGTKEVIPARIVGQISKMTIMPKTTAPTTSLPALIEFDKPKSAVASATLSFVMTEHWGGSSSLEGYLLNPPINNKPVERGVASAAGVMDADITNVAGVIGAHRYLDGTKNADFIRPGTINPVERNFDPAIFGTGPRDTTKLPHMDANKWINPGSDWNIIPSSYSGEGFTPLAPGLGALRLGMKGDSTVVDGSVVGYSGTSAGDAQIFLPEPLYGNVDRIFIRYYFRLGTNSMPTPERRKQVYNKVGYAPSWTNFGGKWGIVPDHSTNYGGYSGSSGGGKGWQLRSSWTESDASTGGPDEGGWGVGHHLYDFNFSNPKGYNYGGGDPVPAGSIYWGEGGGLGGMLYAGKWYCVENELKLNTITDAEPGYLADGVLRTWIDGRLAYESVGMVFRTKPNVYPASPVRLRPVRQLGVRSIKLNWFHGGKTLSTLDRTTFYTGLVWSTKYIGPMKLDCDPALLNCPSKSTTTTPPTP